jgi:hypothetical protein
LAGADPNITDSEGLLAAHYACMVSKPGYEELLETLLARGENQAVLPGRHRVSALPCGDRAKWGGEGPPQSALPLGRTNAGVLVMPGR